MFFFFLRICTLVFIKLRIFAFLEINIQVFRGGYIKHVYMASVSTCSDRRPLSSVTFL